MLSYNSESGSSAPYRFEDYLKIDFHDWINIRILLCFFPTSDSKTLLPLGGAYEGLQ